MTDSDDRPRPAPRSRPTPAPSPRPRIAGSRREREHAAATGGHLPEGKGEEAPAVAAPRRGPAPGTARSSGAGAEAPGAHPGSPGTRVRALVLVLALACLAAAAAAGVLAWQRTHPSHVTPSVFSSTASGVEALYAYDYRDSEGSIERKLDVLTGDLRDQYETDLSQGGMIDAYEQVSATTRYEVLDVGLQQINQAQDSATLVVFGQYVVESVTSGQEPAPAGSECQVTSEGAQSCTQTLQVGVVQVDGEWKIHELTLLTTS